ncbi:hypothetical protein KM043_016569 [Ampulex compressa]|nr:hypothetical protein KM043_016569 [Ampulex compressa]
MNGHGRPWNAVPCIDVIGRFFGRSSRTVGRNTGGAGEMSSRSNRLEKGKNVGTGSAGKSFEKILRKECLDSSRIMNR